MILFDISDTSIEAVQLSKSFLTGESINCFARGEFKDGPIKAGEILDRDALRKIIANLLGKAKPKAMKDQECAFTLPDKRVYTHRFVLSQRQDSETVLGLVKAQVEKLIPQPLEELAYDYSFLDQGRDRKDGGEIFLMAIPRVILDSYLKLFGTLHLKPKLAVSESFAAWSFLAPVIQPDETILFLDVGEEISTAALMDKRGVVETFTEPVQTDKLFTQLKSLFEFACTRAGGCIEQVILGGGGSLKINLAEAKKKLGLEVISGETAFESFKIPIKVDFGELSRVLFANVLGLAFLSKEEKPLNLIKP